MGETYGQSERERGVRGRAVRLLEPIAGPLVARVCGLAQQQELPQQRPLPRTHEVKRAHLASQPKSLLQSVNQRVGRHGIQSREGPEQYNERVRA